MKKLFLMMVCTGIAMLTSCSKPAETTVNPATANASQNAESNEAPIAAPEEKQEGMLREVVERDDEVLLPGITIDLQYDDETRKKLIETGETTIVDYSLGVFPEDPIPGFEGEIGSDGTFWLANIEVELSGDKSQAVIHHATTERSRYDALTEKNRDNVELLINVYSGRKASEDNILNCGIVQGPLKDFGGKAYPVECTLLHMP